MLIMPDAEIGGAIVRRTFTNGDTRYKAGDNLTAEQVLAMGMPNRRALIDTQYMELYPKAPLAPDMPKGERIIVALGKDRFNVIEGRTLNDQPLTRADAEKLAHEA